MLLWVISSHLVSLVFLMVSSLIFMGVGLTSLGSSVSWVIEWEIISLNSSSVVMSLIFDWVSCFFLSFVFFISSLVMYYSGDYMSGDRSYTRFMYLVFAFVLSMGALIISPNLISILLGWDGLGLISYVLVIYYQNEKSANAGMLTVLSNRVGDVGILLSIGLMSTLGGWSFIFYGEEVGESLFLVKIMVCIAAMTKSAQIPFSAWLPAAMAAPTPVSALVHSSTLVTAGVYLLIRFSEALVGSGVQSFLLIVSCLTMFMAGLGANFEFDLKKIIALSTLSQLGVMMSVLALGFLDLAFFHLLTHALFKALLFMCAGMVIHSVGEAQDIRSMGSLVVMMPFTVVSMSLANLALSGMPFLAGFYSKDLILEVAFMSEINMVSVLLYIFATGLTVCYTFRLIYYSLSGVVGMRSVMLVGEEYKMMVGSVGVLSGAAVVGGAFLAWLLFPDPYMICLSVVWKGLVFFLSLAGASLGYIVNMVGVSHSLKSLGVYFFLVFSGTMWFMPLLSSFKVSLWGFKGAGYLFQVGDKGWLEHFGAQGSHAGLVRESVVLQMSQNNMIMLYMKSLFFWLVIIFFILV
uniref:NADH-ubiquinone oxidoreductase chain 5 n=1 Tax=Tenuibranchiurus glypticus TaxID=99779 RepID=A0A0A0QXE3_9EUCA|nr:NADH dehydrogenase subunit 5 [Tenuibranchiurus glypticus]AIU94543.1 NADH dehydrogenase subunit 5 [Tenuibranchiurus glypticus]